MNGTITIEVHEIGGIKVKIEVEVETIEQLNEMVRSLSGLFAKGN